jgi:NAD(P)H-hydrate epimerase
VICGAGQNGGDGFVIARHLANRGAEVHIHLGAERGRVSGDARTYLTVVERLGLPIEDLAHDSDPSAWTRRLAGVEIIRRTPLRDRPARPGAGRSGGGDPGDERGRGLAGGGGHSLGPGRRHGAVHGVAVQADLTATMGALKLGLVVDARRRSGPSRWSTWASRSRPGRRPGAPGEYLDRESMTRLLPRARPSDHKGTRGHALVLAGSVGKTGAAVLAGRAALRAGAGLVTLASTADGQRALDAKVLELMTACYAAGSDADEQSYQQVLDLGRRMQVVALGPGIPPARAPRRWCVAWRPSCRCRW